MRGLLALLPMMGLAATAPSFAQTVTPPPGTVITNTASATFALAPGPPATLSSNTVGSAVAAGPPAALSVVVASPTSSSTPGSAVTLTVSASDGGGSAAWPVAVSVNGVSESLFVVSLPVPANTTFAAARAGTAGAQTLYHQLGTAAGVYATVDPPGPSVDAVAWALPDLPAGASLAGQLIVTVNANASTSFSATAVAAWAGTPAGPTQSTASNTLVIHLPVLPAQIGYFTSASYALQSVVGAAGSPLYVQVNAAACNTDPTRVLTVPVTLTSRLTGDTETFTATETGPNTGLYRILPDVPTASAATHPVQSGDGILEVQRDDTVTATVSRCGPVAVSATTTLLVDPAGVAYNSRTNQPLGGATVSLIDVTGAGNGGNAGGAARVFATDGVTTAPATVVSAADGSYSFPLVAPSTYRLAVTPPGGYVFPSKLPPAQQPAGRFVDSQGSYGKDFVISGTQSAPVRFDLPLDSGAGAATPLLVQKSADKLTAQPGDFVDYAVQINNGSGGALANTAVNDSLPAGFSYVRGSARLNGAPLADPSGGVGPQLRFSLGALAAGVQDTLSYRVRVGVGAQGGSGVNTAQAVSGSLTSNQAAVAVQIVGGVFDNKAYLIGKVYADCNGNGVQDPGEPGVPGVRIYLEDGTYAVTDEEGKYSLYGLIPRLHVAKVDSTTLPAGASLEVLDHRNALAAGSAFVDLTNGELHKTNFALAGCPDALRADIAARRQGLKNPSEILQAAGSLFSGNAQATTVDARSEPASGAIRLPGDAGGVTGAGAPMAPMTMNSAMAGVVPFTTSAAPLGAAGDPGGPYAPHAQGLPQPLNTPAAALLADQSIAAGGAAGAPTRAAQAGADESDFADFRALQEKLSRETLEKVLPRLDNAVGFVNLSDGQVLSAAQTPVQVKGPLGATFELTVNGKPVPDSQIGKKSRLESTGVQAFEYVGVDLHPGRNRLVVRALDPFGNARGSAEISVLAPGELARIVFEAPASAVADASSAIAVTLRLRDANDLPVVARLPVTVSASLGRWQLARGAPDSTAPDSSGQVLVSNGVAKLWLLPPAQPGKAELTATSGTVKSATTVSFTPNLRPLLGVGLVTGTINLRNLNPAALQPAQDGDVFEREIVSASQSFDGGKDDVGARTALFLKGKVLGSTLLTLAYDSDKPGDTTLFRDIQPDQFYPVYGDSSERGFDAQSTGKLYVMVQNGTNYALYGDYTTQSDNPARQLTQYSRALNGAKEHWQLGRLTVDSFASDTASTQSVVEFRANGTSGPFQLALSGVTNSQQVDIITRDRNQPSVILADTPLTPFADYEIEPYTGLLLLKSPVPSVDPGLNPIFIHVSYEIDTGGPKHWVEGADARLQVTPGLTLGATAIHDPDPSNSLTLEGVNATDKLDAHTVGTAELARSSTDLAGDGSAERLDVQHTDGTLEAHLWGTHTDADFYNPNSLQSAGASEYGAKATWRLDAKDRVVLDSLKTANSTTGAEQTGAELKLERTLPKNAKLEVGMRHSEANAASILSAPPLPGVATELTATGTTPPPAAPAVPPVASPTTPVDSDYTSARVKLTVPVPDLKGAEVFGVAEQAVDGTDGREDGVGGSYALNSTTHLYGEHDFSNTLNGPYTLNSAVSQYTSVAGIASTLPDSTQAFDEYRVGDGIDGRSSESAIGLRHLWKLSDGLGLTASVQRIEPLSGVVSDTASAVTVGATYTPKTDWKASGQAQWQTSATSHSWLVTGAVAHKIDRNWTVLERALYTQETDLAGGGTRELARVQSGLAYRPVDSDLWNALGQVEYKRDFDTTLGPTLNLDQQAWIFAGNVNFQPARGWQLSARYAAEHEIDWTLGFDDRSFTQLAGARSIWDFGARWDAGLQSYRMWGDGTAQNAYGVEVGYLVWKNLWLSVGYNIQGFDAPDLSGSAYTQRGIYLHLSFKFDESLFAGSPLSARETAAPRLTAGRLP